MSSAFIGAIGIGVSDLEKSTDFYCRVLGMKKIMSLNLPDMDEEILTLEGKGASLLLMHFTDASSPNYRNNPTKIVFNVPDAAACVEAVRAEGLQVIREAAAVPSMNDAVIALVKDPDGYVVEFIQK